ncbi:prephenate/arogenate dehydrogenase family protein [Fodinicurvata sp. EGI_FJ10296]|uniref:prephenate/arogenate dehydrogenase family protein n=1 Tax=Fodinicurvata sp. EGI_FJ10296 TaxID=3231908 RepID=UPI0034549908
MTSDDIARTAVAETTSGKVPGTSKPIFPRLCLIGLGLIASSVAWAAKRDGLVDEIVGTARSPETMARAVELGFVDRAVADPAEAVAGADLVMLCTPLSTFAELAERIAPNLKPGAVLTDAGSVKHTVIKDVGPFVPDGVHFVPGHPIAGTEHSGPDSGFADLFKGRWCILTPPEGTSAEAVDRLSEFWTSMGAMIEVMDAEHHDKVLAITSHLPHLIAYTIVGTAVDLEESTKEAVIKFSASGFRDFTRIAASDPTMWRDIFLSNREATLEMCQRFSEDLTALQRAIRWGEADKLHELFTRTRAIRRGIIDANQA